MFCLEDDIEAAQELGLRFHAARGSMSVGEGHGGLPPDDLVEKESDILRDCERLIETWHDPKPQSMLRIVVAPCSPFSVSVDLMRGIGGAGAGLWRASAYAPGGDR